MNERTLIAANLKIVGFCILLLGGAHCLRGIYDGCANLYVLNHPPKMWISEDIPEKIRAEETRKHEQEVMAHKLVYQDRTAGSVGEAIKGLVVLCVGLYLCRRGQPIVRFLAGSAIEDDTKA